MPRMSWPRLHRHLKGGGVWQRKKEARRSALSKGPTEGDPATRPRGACGKGPLEVTYDWVVSALVARLGRCCDNDAPTIDIQDSIGRLDTTRAASCGTSPAKSAERKIQRHGRVQANAAPTAVAASTSDHGLRCAMGLTTALDASFAMCATGRIGWCPHHDVTDSSTSCTSGNALNRLSNDSCCCPGAPCGFGRGGSIARRRRSRDASIRSSAALKLRSLRAA